MSKERGGVEECCAGGGVVVGVAVVALWQWQPAGRERGGDGNESLRRW